MRVATWNLWWRFGPWPARQPAIVETLRAIDADVILLQEVFGPTNEAPDQAEALASDLGMHWIATTEPDPAGTDRTPFDGHTNRTPFDGHTNRTPFDGHTNRTPFGNAVLSRWPILDRRQRFLPGADGLPSHRSALWALLDHPDGPQPVATTHLDWRYDASSLRQEQLDDLVNWLAERHEQVGRRLDAAPDEHRSLILGGDFNAVPESDEIRRLVGLAPPYGSNNAHLRVFTDAWAACGDGPGHTWTRDNEHTADAQWPRRRLDYLLSSWPRPKPTGNPVSCFIEGLHPVEGVVPSDHSCVVADFDDRPAFA